MMNLEEYDPNIQTPYVPCDNPENWLWQEINGVMYPKMLIDPFIYEKKYCGWSEYDVETIFNEMKPPTIEFDQIKREVMERMEKYYDQNNGMCIVQVQGHIEEVMKAG